MRINESGGVTNSYINELRPKISMTIAQGCVAYAIALVAFGPHMRPPTKDQES